MPVPNSFETDGRGPSERHLLMAGIAMFVVATVTTGLLLVKSTGRLDDYIRVVAELVNVGDGLPAKSDVKFQGVLVGSVDEVVPAQDGGRNLVHINLKPDLAATVPQTVTARVVPSNVFAVSSVQLLERGDGPPIAAGARIPEDVDLPTVLFQTTISKLRDIVGAAGRGRGDTTVGILQAVAAATDNRRATLLESGAQLTRMLHELNMIVATDTGPSTVSALVNASEGLKGAAPDLVDALHQAVKPMQTVAEKRVQLEHLIAAGVSTTATVRQAFDNQTDRLIEITTNLTPVVGVLAQNSGQFLPITSRLKVLSDKFFSELWDPGSDTFTVRTIVSFTPSTTYTRADCPQYGDLKGPSCFTAPEIVVRPDLPDTLLPQNYQPPPDLSPPPGTVLGPNGNLQAVGPPMINPDPNLSDPNPPLPWWTGPAPRVPGSADPGDATPEQTAPAAFGGTVGPVGSSVERNQLSQIVGGSATTSTQLLLGPVARGTEVSVTRETEAAK